MYIWLKTSAPLLVVSKSLGKKKRHDTVLLLVVDRDRECWNWGTSLLQSVAERQARPSAYKEMLESYRYWERDECLHVGKRFLPRDAQHSTPLLNLLCIHFYFPEEKSNRPITHLSIHAGNIPLFWHLSLSLLYFHIQHSSRLHSMLLPALTPTRCFRLPHHRRVSSCKLKEVLRKGTFFETDDGKGKNEVEIADALMIRWCIFALIRLYRHTATIQSHSCFGAA